MNISLKKLAISAAATSLLFVGAGCTWFGGQQASTNTPGGDGAYVNANQSAGANTNGGANGNTNGAAPAPRTATISLTNASGAAGTVTLTDLAGNNTRVDVSLSGPASTKESLPAAIYAGSCTTQDAEIQYPLNPVARGKSTTTLNVNIGALLDKQPQALKVKGDAVDAMAPYAACASLR